MQTWQLTGHDESRVPTALALPSACLVPFPTLPAALSPCQALKTEAQTLELAARTLVSARLTAWDTGFPFPLAQVRGRPNCPLPLITLAAAAAAWMEHPLPAYSLFA